VSLATRPVDAWAFGYTQTALLKQRAEAGGGRDLGRRDAVALASAREYGAKSTPRRLLKAAGGSVLPARIAWDGLRLCWDASRYEEAARTSASFLARRAARTAYCASSIASAANSIA
jgi:hypothetical protein